MSNRLHSKGQIALVVALSSTYAFFIAATTAVYLHAIGQKSLLTETIRLSGWTAYQVQLEYIESRSSLNLAIKNVSDEHLHELALRLESLLSRVPLITQSDEGQFLASLPGVSEMADDLKTEVSLILDEIYAFSISDPDMSKRIESWNTRLEPFGVSLQSMLQKTVAYNENVYQREGNRQQSSAFLQLASVVVSGGILVLLLITQVNRAERSLEISRIARLRSAGTEASLRRIVEAAPVAFVVVEPDTDTVVYVNRTATDLLGRDVNTSSWRAAIRQCRRAVEVRATDPCDRPETFAPVTLQHATGSVISADVMRNSVVWNEHEQHLYSLVDRTRSRNAEREALQASTLIAIGEMAASIVHEINQPLATMKMASANARALIQENADPAKIAVKVARIDAQVDRVRHITEQVRRLVRSDTDRPKSFFVAREAIELTSAAMLEQFNKSDIALSLSIGSLDRATVLGDQLLFEQALINVLTNAGHAFSRKDRDRSVISEVRVEASVHDGSLRILISDNARGIRPDVVDRFPNVFVTTSTPDLYTGMYLTLTRNIIVGMNGSITSANVDGGTQFMIEIPVREAPSSVGEI